MSLGGDGQPCDPALGCMWSALSACAGDHTCVLHSWLDV
jgi:hypothetical protein